MNRKYIYSNIWDAPIGLSEDVQHFPHSCFIYVGCKLIRIIFRSCRVESWRLHKWVKRNQEETDELNKGSKDVLFQEITLSPNMETRTEDMGSHVTACIVLLETDWRLVAKAFTAGQHLFHVLFRVDGSPEPHYRKYLLIHQSHTGHHFGSIGPSCIRQFHRFIFRAPVSVCWLVWWLLQNKLLLVRQYDSLESIFRECQPIITGGKSGLIVGQNENLRKGQLIALSFCFFRKIR